LRAQDLMKKHGVRPSHIAQNAIVAVNLAFIPLPEEVQARKLQGITTTSLIRDASKAHWLSWGGGQAPPNVLRP